MAAGGQAGVSRALDRMGYAGKVRVICFDLVPNNIQNLLDSRIDFLIGQDEHTQGFQPVMLLFDRVFSGKSPETRYFYTDISIKNKYNV